MTFFAYPDLMTKIDEIVKNCPKFFHRVIFAFWIQIYNPNLCKSHIFWITANIEKWSFFAYPYLMTKIDEIEKIARNSFMGLFLRLWIQICNPNLCKSHIFWITANIEKWSFFCIPGPDDQNRWNRKIARNSFIGNICVLNSNLQPNLCKPHIFWNTANTGNDLILHTRTWWPKSMKSEKLPEILS